MPKFWVATLVVIAALVAGCASAGGPPSPHTVSTRRIAASKPLPQGTVLASYPGGNTIYKEIREKKPRTDGYYHIDTRASIAELKALHINTYLFLIWHSPTDWQDLNQQFLPAARKAGIDVWIYLVPPSECRLPNGWCSRPYMEDYVAWGRHIAQLSKRYSNLKAWAIDDFTNGANSAVFTPQYMRQIRNAVNAINPDIGLYTTAYYSTATNNAFYEKYSPYIRGVIFPFLDQSSGAANTQVTSSLQTELDAVTAHASSHGTKVLLMIYSGRFSALDEPTARYVRMAIGIGKGYARRGRIEGICSYGTPHSGAPAVSSDLLAMFGRGSLVFHDQGGSTPAGSFESASQTVRVDPNAPRYSVSFWRYNRYYRAPTAGRLMQVLIDGHVIWSSDIAGDISADNHEFRWMQQTDNGPPIEIDSSYLHGRTQATLTFRIYETQAADYRSVTAFDTVQTSGISVTNPGFERQSSWKLHSTSGSLLPEIYIYDPELPSHVFGAVAKEFAR